MSILTRQWHSDNRQSDTRQSNAQQFNLPDATVMLWPDWLDRQQGGDLQQQLQQQLNWSQDSIMMFGKAVTIPRLQVWMGDAHCSYRYSGTTFMPQPWQPQVQLLAQQLSAFLQLPFNCVLLNWYQNGVQHMGWHADNEPELGPDPYIASLSLGATRRFELKHRRQAWQLALDLTPGSLLLMADGCQQHWLHRLPKQSRVTDSRVNLTFRYINSAG
ncbi:alpha-ketoglutarate-dependent dioxygenase AlkB [Rheinheimera sp.]|uniref:alpha-ketoglutarate-dependent dioxygenase AlkB family protein n=1 Tax=Rheinheimera sp. TaxID=1869214 RepID=UPI002734E673|nr:alpha-ketoglutarate-dependent dioxygenase AlkB [Rheinheimera sp.]MDP2714987.1 alpha-ketoglutarate-dependent dioxygenase AlkB [Rheinheimera sp.]